TLLAAASPESSPEALGSLTVGERDARLLALRQSTFGSKLKSLASCPRCGERIEAAFDIADIPTQFGTEPRTDAFHVSVEEYELRFRLPNALDVAAVVDAPDLPSARNRLLDGCLTAIHRAGAETPLDSLPESVVQMVIERMEAADPRANLWLALT